MSPPTGTPYPFFSEGHHTNVSTPQMPQPTGTPPPPFSEAHHTHVSTPQMTQPPLPPPFFEGHHTNVSTPPSHSIHGQQMSEHDRAEPDTIPSSVSDRRTHDVDPIVPISRCRPDISHHRDSDDHAGDREDGINIISLFAEPPVQTLDGLVADASDTALEEDTTGKGVFPEGGDHDSSSIVDLMGQVSPELKM